MPVVIYVPRVFGGTIVLTVPSSGTSFTLLIVASFRDGEQPAQYRDFAITAGGR